MKKFESLSCNCFWIKRRVFWWKTKKYLDPTNKKSTWWQNLKKFIKAKKPKKRVFVLFLSGVERERERKNSCTRALKSRFSRVSSTCWNFATCVVPPFFFSLSDEISLLLLSRAQFSPPIIIGYNNTLKVAKQHTWLFFFARTREYKRERERVKEKELIKGTYYKNDDIVLVFSRYDDAFFVFIFFF